MNNGLGFQELIIIKQMEQNMEYIKTKFSQLRSKEDLLSLLNEVNVTLYGEECHKLSLNSLNYFSNPKICKKRYKSFTIPKKSGGERFIHAPVNGLKSILRPLNFVLNAVSTPHFKATGFVPGKSIVDNAKQHVGKHYVYNIDLKDFFHSFDRNWVKYGFMIPPFNLGKEREELAFFLASLCTHPFEVDGEIKTVLPQGAPTSPTITNILCYKLDRRLHGLAKRFKITYSRYADDITFSSQTSVFRKEAFLDELHRIIEDQKLEVNPKKTRTQKAGFRQEVTGLLVNEKVNVNARYIKQLRMWLYYWERYGYAKAQEIFLKDYYKDKSHVKKINPSNEEIFRNVLMGKLDFLKMAKGKTDSAYYKLKERFDKLNVNPKIDEVIAVWETQGIEEAISVYNNKKENKISLEFIPSIENGGFIFTL